LRKPREPIDDLAALNISFQASTRKPALFKLLLAHAQFVHRICNTPEISSRRTGASNGSPGSAVTPTHLNPEHPLLASTNKPSVGIAG
jgi:hypothetical protein